MRCEEVEHYSAEYLAGTMPASAAFMEHLAQCSRCRAEIEGLRDTWQDLKAIHPPERAAIMQPNVLSTLEAVRSEVHHTTNWRKVMPYAVASIVIVLAPGLVLKLFSITNLFGDNSLITVNVPSPLDE